MVIIYPTVIQPMFNKLSPLATGDLRNRIESLASKLNFPLKHLYEIDGSKRSSHSNAYFFGLPWVCALVDVHTSQLRAVFRANTSLSSILSFNKASPKKLRLFLVRKISNMFFQSTHLSSRQLTNLATGTTSTPRR